MWPLQNEKNPFSGSLTTTQTTYPRLILSTICWPNQSAQQIRLSQSKFTPHVLGTVLIITITTTSPALEKPNEIGLIGLSSEGKTYLTICPDSYPWFCEWWMWMWMMNEGSMQSSSSIEWWVYWLLSCVTGNWSFRLFENISVLLLAEIEYLVGWCKQLFPLLICNPFIIDQPVHFIIKLITRCSEFTALK